MESTQEGIIMTDEERDEKITAMHNDICWLKKLMEKHLAEHSKYIYGFIFLIGGVIVGIVV